MIDIFIKDIFSKNNTDLNKVKADISDEQRETLKKSFHQLKGQVEKFIYDKNASKTITEKDQTNSEAVSPLRGKFFKQKEAKDNTDETKE